MRNLFVIALIATATLLAGCSNDQQAAKKFVDTSSKIATASATTDDGTPKRVPIKKTNRVLLGDNYLATEHGDPLPERVEGANGFVLSNMPAHGQLTLAELALRISKYTGLTVLVADPDKSAEKAKDSAKTTASDSTVQTITDLVGADPERADTVASAEVRDYSGPLSAFLNQQLPRYNQDWDVHGQVIYFGRELWRTYAIVDMPSSTTLSAGLNGGGSSSSSPSAGATPGTASATAGASTAGTSGSGGGGTGGQSTSTTTTIDGWTELLGTLAAYTHSADKVVPERSNGQVTVTCPRYCQGLAKAFVDSHNKTAGRQVMITLAVLKIQKTGSDDYGFDPTLIYKNLPTGYSLSVLGQATSVASSAGSVTGSIINPPAGSTAAKFDGTALAVQALTKDEEVTGNTSKYGIIANNRPWSVRNALDYGYVQNLVTSVSTSLSNSAAQVTTQVIGDQLQVVPRIQQDGFIRLQLALSQTAIQSKDVVTIGNTQTTIPQILDNSSSPMEFTIRNGATLVLSDIADDTADRVRSGAGSIFNWLTGGQATATNDRQKTIIIVTAREWHPGDPGVTFAEAHP
ncbi:MAG TPA: hypothetical protein VGU69_10435 [Rhizomicrobium sp.]|nr:hypothetical protein [Rhizomicrobium sp.]